MCCRVSFDLLPLHLKGLLSDAWSPGARAWHRGFSTQSVSPAYNIGKVTHAGFQVRAVQGIRVFRRETFDDDPEFQWQERMRVCHALHTLAQDFISLSGLELKLQQVTHQRKCASTAPVPAAVRLLGKLVNLSELR